MGAPGPSRPARILIVEDDRSLVGLMAMFLGQAGHDVAIAYDGASGLRQLSLESADLVILDLGLPGIGGEDVLRAIRDRSDTPVIVVTARREPSEVAHILDLGAEDHVGKPFAREELLARVRATLRRHRGQSAVGRGELGVEVDLRRHEARVAGRELQLARIEFGLFACLASGGVATIERLLHAGWGSTADVDPGLLRGALYRLRVKLEAIGSDLAIESVRRVGYRLVRRDRAGPAFAS